jgi:hypothetical protein
MRDEGGKVAAEARLWVLRVIYWRPTSGAREALRARPRRRPRPRPRFLAGGVLEYWSIGVLRLLRIAPAQRAGATFRARFHQLPDPGLKPGL